MGAQTVRDLARSERRESSVVSISWTVNDDIDPLGDSKISARRFGVKGDFE
jgi:hypothetical protein